MGLVGAGGLAVLVVVDDQVAAYDGQAAVGAVVANVPGTVGVCQHVLRRQALVGAEAERLRDGVGLPVGGAYRLGADVGGHRAEPRAGAGGG